MNDFEAIAAAAGARDLFVLHRIDALSVVNVGGYGRGAGWAGNLHLEPMSEPWLSHVLEDGTARRASGVPMRLFGPYWAAEACATVDGDRIVVFGGEGMSKLSPDDLERYAHEAAELASEVAPSKLLADELEITQAALDIATMRVRSAAEIASGLAMRVARALSCEFGAVLLLGPPLQLFLADEGWRPAASDDEIVAALLPLVPAVRHGLLVEQDLGDSVFAYRPLAIDDGLVSRAALPLGPDGSIGIVVAAHAASSPRGFTTLCQRVFGTAARTAETMLADALAGV